MPGLSTEQLDAMDRAHTPRSRATHQGLTTEQINALSGAGQRVHSYSPPVDVTSPAAMAAAAGTAPGGPNQSPVSQGIGNVVSPIAHGVGIAGAYLEPLTAGGAALGPVMGSFLGTEGQGLRGHIGWQTFLPEIAAVADPRVRADYGDIVHRLVAGHFSPQAMQDVDDRYALFAPAHVSELHREYPDDLLFSYLHQHPRISDIGFRTVTDLIGIAPSSLTRLIARAPGISHALEGGARVMRAAGETRLGRPVAGAIRATRLAGERAVNRFAPLRQASNLRGTPAQAEQVGRSVAASSGIPEQNANTVWRQVFSRTNRVQRNEIERRSEGLPSNTTVPEPKKGPSLDERARMHRNTMQAMTEEQHARKLLEPRRTFDANTYSYRTGRNYTNHEDVQEFSARRSGGSGSGVRRGSSASQGGHKVFATQDEARASGLLSPRYDAGDNFLEYLRQRGANVAYSDSLRALTPIGLAHEIETIDPETGASLGRGERGAQAGRGLEQVRAETRATQSAARKVGLSVPQVRRVQRIGSESSISRLNRQLEEAQRAGKAAAASAAPGARAVVRAAGQTVEDTGRQIVREAVNTSQKLAGREVRATGRNVRIGDLPVVQAEQHLADKLVGPKAPIARRIAALASRVAESGLAKPQLAAFEQAYKVELERQLRMLQGSTERSVDRELRARGFQRGETISRRSNLRGLPELTKHIAYDKNAAHFLETEFGVGTEDASGFMSWMNGVNKLYRIGVITNPLRHVFFNLGTNYLASGGGLGFFLPTGHDSLWSAPDEAWLQRAEKATAISHSAESHPLFGGSAGTTFLTPYSEVFNEASTAAGGGWIGAMHGSGAMVNATASRIWAANQRVVFDVAEERYATALFRQLVEHQGMTDAEAGIRVRQALGDYANVSRAGLERQLSNLMLFYPWMKTSMLFWPRVLLGGQHPLAWLPAEVTQRYNTASGDPNVTHEATGTLYLGHWAGQDWYSSFPGPQKYLYDMAEIAAPYGQPGADVTAHTLPASYLVTGHLRPWPWGIASDLGQTLYQSARQPGGANFDTVYNKNADPQTQLMQILQFLGQELPFVQQAQGVGRGFGEAGSAVQNRDPRAALPPLAGAASLNVYGKP